MADSPEVMVEYYSRQCGKIGGRGMRAEILEIRGDWRQVADAARTTVGMNDGQGEPPYTYRKKLLLAEHSPIRLIEVLWEWERIPYWVMGHLVRHHVGIQPYVQTSREDRTGRRRSPEDKVRVRMIANVQAIISVSRKRLCGMAHEETREAWIGFLKALREHLPEVVDICVPECVYRGFCPELKPCGRWRDRGFSFDSWVQGYRKISSICPNGTESNREWEGRVRFRLDQWSR